jgi:hypothetical protein
LVTYSSGTGEILVEVLLDLDDCLLSEALFKSLLPESNLKLRGISFEVARVDCALKLVFRSSDPRLLIPPLSNSLRLVSTVLETLKNLTLTESSS